METIVRGTALKYGDNINTDIISPPQYMELPIAEAAQYAMGAVDSDFPKKAGPEAIMVAGANFGSGSSRETSPLTLKHLGIRVIVAKFFARIFYRNGINVGIVLIECKDADRIADGDELIVHPQDGRIENVTRGESYQCDKIPPHIMKLIERGGLVPSLREQFAK